MSNKRKYNEPSTKPLITGHFGYNYAGPGNSLDGDKPELDGSEKSKTELASYYHDHDYHDQGNSAYISSNASDRDWIANAGNDPVGVLGKLYFGSKIAINAAVAPGKTLNELMAPTRHNERQSRLGDYYRTTKRQKTSEVPQIEGSKDMSTISTDVTPNNTGQIVSGSIQDGSGGFNSYSTEGTAAEVVPEQTGWAERTHVFGQSRSYAVNATDNSLQFTGDRTGPEGWTHVDGSIWTMGWNMIPNNDINLYMTPNDKARIYENNAYEYKVNYIAIKGYNIVMSQSSANTSTNNITERPIVKVFKDTRNVFYNNGEGYNAAVKLHEDQGVLNQQPLTMEYNNYWVPKSITPLDNIPQIERLGGMEILQPGANIMYYDSGFMGFKPLYDQGGDAHNLSLYEMKQYYQTNTHLVPLVSDDILTTNIGVGSIIENRMNPVKPWLIKIDAINMPGGDTILARANIYFDYEISITVKYRTNNYLPKYTQLIWADSGKPFQSNLPNQWRNAIEVQRSTGTKIEYFKASDNQETFKTTRID